jgi:hypothetical protein
MIFGATRACPVCRLAGELHEEGVVGGGYRDVTPARVLRGTAAAPLRIRKLAAATSAAA